MVYNDNTILSKSMRKIVNVLKSNPFMSHTKLRAPTQATSTILYSFRSQLTHSRDRNTIILMATNTTE